MTYGMVYCFDSFIWKAEQIVSTQLKNCVFCRLNYLSFRYYKYVTKGEKQRKFNLIFSCNSSSLHNSSFFRPIHIVRWWKKKKITREPIYVVGLTNDQAYIHRVVLDFSSVVKWWWGRAKDPIKIVLKKRMSNMELISFSRWWWVLLADNSKEEKKNYPDDDDCLVNTAGFRTKRQVVNSSDFSGRWQEKRKIYHVLFSVLK
jgi:hypothetical protein